MKDKLISKLKYFKIFRKLFYLKGRLKVIKRINNTLIDVIESSNEKDSFIRLTNGKIFTGQKTNQKILYFLLKRQLRKKVHINLMQILFDIDFRYMNRESTNLDLKECKYLELKDGDVVLEVGAYIGYHAIRMSEIVGNNGKVIAIEAIKENYDIMVRNIELNQITNIIPINIGIWKKKETIIINTDQGQKNSIRSGIVKAKNRIEINGDTLDNVCNKLNLKKIDFIRIQLNGAELEALEGMTEIMNRAPKFLIAVLYGNREVIQQFLNNKGYTVKHTETGILAEKYKNNLKKQP